MAELDCETRESTLASVATIYGVPDQQIEHFLHATDLEKHYAENDVIHTGEIELAHLFEKRFGCVAAPLERVFWFHITRAPQGTDFADGIQPLGTALDRVWDSMFKIFKGTAHEERLRKLRASGVGGFQYALKTGDLQLHGGPYAMLVREAAFRPAEIGNHDYLWLPEIMEDICNAYAEAHGDQIHDVLCGALAPYIVKFWSTQRTDMGCVEAALYYLYCVVHNDRMTMHANTCFDGKNSTIAANQIVSVAVAPAAKL